jgi:hypothetical protein
MGNPNTLSRAIDGIMDEMFLDDVSKHLETRFGEVNDDVDGEKSDLEEFLNQLIQRRNKLEDALKRGEETRDSEGKPLTREQVLDLIEIIGQQIDIRKALISAKGKGRGVDSIIH